ncbi:hypothetical protein CDAR_441111 [Caerostris darwini]|uniref:Uncharacterized protein n=1 Tax=Caerostris darwini TaxID=1538125 RepID=A0AAV4Q7W2_9ARAC|nr:hypothetical protein CDAR_441111 [Caerostris darwini]
MGPNHKHTIGQHHILTWYENLKKKNVKIPKNPDKLGRKKPSTLGAPKVLIFGVQNPIWQPLAIRIFLPAESSTNISFSDDASRIERTVAVRS